jgi:hypothetical protein
MLGILPKFYKFKITNSSSFGRGIIATDAIVDGEIICKITGAKINLREFFDKYEIDGCNVFQFGYDEYIDAIEPYVCFNHSCDPNAGIRNNGVIFALKKIKKGEEIFFDYSTITDDVIWSMECKCGSKQCRKLIGDFQTIPHNRKEFYRKKGAISAHIKSVYY